MKKNNFRSLAILSIIMLLSSITAYAASQPLKQSFSLTVDIKGSGAVSATPSYKLYPSGSEVIVKALPAMGWRLDHWEGDFSGHDVSAIVKMNSNKNITAVFVLSGNTPEKNGPLFKITSKVVGSGTIFASPSKDGYNAGASVTLDAVGQTGWKFKNWTGDLSGNTTPVTIIMNSDKSIGAEFVKAYYLFSSVRGEGSITTSPEKSQYISGSQVTLAATAKPGWKFSNWSGDITGNQNPLTLTMDSTKTVNAVFIQTYRVSTSVRGNGTLTLTPAKESYDYGEIVVLTALADHGWKFHNWDGDGSGYDNIITIKIDGNKSVTAVFQDQSKSHGLD